MSTPASGAATLPRHFRFDLPTTPEPEPQPDSVDVHPPSLPRPRFKLKRRAVSNLSAPTQQFLASVAAADLPIPSIEEPDGLWQHDADMKDAVASPSQPPFSLHQLGVGVFREEDEEDRSCLHTGRAVHSNSNIHVNTRSATATGTVNLSLPPPPPPPPRTPVPDDDTVPSLSPKRYPDWSIDSAFDDSCESSPECDSSRPSTARSTQTSTSLFSRCSLLSDDLQFASPSTTTTNSETKNDMTNEINSETKNEARHDVHLEPFPGLMMANDILSKNTTKSDPSRSDARRRKAPWTRAMDQHLWSTYVIYLQDPRVTPFRTSKSGLPPHGVCVRVGREAKRSWKGAKNRARLSDTDATGPATGPATDEDKSGSNTPTTTTTTTMGKPRPTFIQWPHTLSATRTRLMDLCRIKSAPSHVRNAHILSHSPTPYGRTAARCWNRRSTPARSPSVFGHDMVMSLTMSTSEAMQPTGPLAQLTGGSSDSKRLGPTSPPLALSIPTKISSAPSTHRVANRSDGLLVDSESAFSERRLGSPFVAQSYGPSSSNDSNNINISNINIINNSSNNSDNSSNNLNINSKTISITNSSTGTEAFPSLVNTTETNPRQTQSLSGTRRNLQSPVRLSRGRASTAQQQQQQQQQKRRSRRTSIEPRKTKRPSLASDLWMDPFAPKPEALRDDMFLSRSSRSTRAEAAAAAAASASTPFVATTTAPFPRPRALTVIAQPSPFVVGSSLTPPTSEYPPRLGSPFSMTTSSFSFPNRLFHPADAVGLETGRRPFATLQSSTNGGGNGDAVPRAAGNLAHRLAYVDQRLRELRRHRRMRSDSPF